MSGIEFGKTKEGNTVTKYLLKNKNGMERQVGKSEVFTKESLIRLQDKMRTLCIEEFNQVYSLDSTLKTKQKGRNKDIHVSDMDNYIELKNKLKRIIKL